MVVLEITLQPRADLGHVHQVSRKPPAATHWCDYLCLTPDVAHLNCGQQESNCREHTWIVANRRWSAEDTHCGVALLYHRLQKEDTVPVIPRRGFIQSSRTLNPPISDWALKCRGHGVPMIYSWRHKHVYSFYYFRPVIEQHFVNDRPFQCDVRRNRNKD
jgi:hypothetical protein